MRQRYLTISNSAAKKCDFLEFQAFLHLLRLSDFGTDIGAEDVAVPGKDKDGKPIKKVVTKHTMVIYFQESEVRRIFDRVQARLIRMKVNNRKALKPFLRSPKAIVAYLGQLVALHNYSEERFVPKIFLGKDRHQKEIWLTVFRVVRNRGGAGRSVLRVRGPDGHDYYVPEPEYGSPVRDQTLRVLTIAGELIDAAISQQPVPTPTTIVVR